jgi:hypothetical protein
MPFDQHGPRMKTLPLVVTLLFFSSALPAAENAPLKTAFATPEQGREVLTTRDDFVTRLSPFDRAARLKTDREVSEEEYLEFVAEHVVAWTDEERETIAKALASLRPKLEPFAPLFPDRIDFVKTTGREEGDAAYTRGQAIILPASKVGAGGTQLERLIAHELFHVLSRHDPKLRDRLYATIGFEPCGEVALPKELEARKLTNPDAPVNRHAIKLTIEGETEWAMPVIFASQEKYDTERGGEFFHYLTLKLLVVDRTDPITARPAKLVDIRQAQDFFDLVGQNTQYIIHPEEILADNFALWAIGEEGLASPEVVARMVEVLEGAGAHSK